MCKKDSNNETQFSQRLLLVFQMAHFWDYQIVPAWASEAKIEGSIGTSVSTTFAFNQLHVPFYALSSRAVTFIFCQYVAKLCNFFNKFAKVVAEGFFLKRKTVLLLLDTARGLA